MHAKSKSKYAVLYFWLKKIRKSKYIFWDIWPGLPVKYPKMTIPKIHILIFKFWSVKNPKLHIFFVILHASRMPRIKKFQCMTGSTVPTNLLRLCDDYFSMLNLFGTINPLKSNNSWKKSKSLWFRGCNKSIFDQSKRSGFVFFFEFRSSHTPPNKKISSLKIIHHTVDQIKTPLLLFRYSLLQSP